MTGDQPEREQSVVVPPAVVPPAGAPPAPAAPERAPRVRSGRRAVLAGAGAVGTVGVVAALAGCDTGTGGDPPTSPPTGGGDPSGTPGNGDNGGDNSGQALASADEIEVGGGILVDGENMVITQPTAGEFRGFSAVCTHEGCIVARVADGLIQCDCHGSRFSIEDGSVVQQASTLPAGADQDPLPPMEVQEEDGQIVRAE